MGGKICVLCLSKTWSEVLLIHSGRVI